MSSLKNLWCCRCSVVLVAGCCSSSSNLCSPVICPRQISLLHFSSFSQSSPQICSCSKPRQRSGVYFFCGHSYLLTGTILRFPISSSSRLFLSPLSPPLSPSIFCFSPSEQILKFDSPVLPVTFSFCFQTLTLGVITLFIYLYIFNKPFIC